MTGFAREAGTTGRHAWAWEIKTVNGRGLDVRLRTPPGFEASGETARKLLSAALSRGQCQLSLAVSRAPGPGGVRINRELLSALIAGLSDVPRPADLGPATLDGLLGVRGVVETEEDGGSPGDDQALQTDLAASAGRLVASLEAARASEGAALAEVIGRQLDAMAALVAAAEAEPGRKPDAVRARLAAQLDLLLGAAPKLDAQRLHQEAALLAAKADIREELDRLGAHLTSARALVAEAGAPVGRRLDFLAQELGREANTLCAKSNDVGLSRIGLDLKVVVEQFREQVQNVE